ncbi:hypothetical protein QYF36_016388 [Acer negundo]|nr:hypothetical protein QYF36_016388 [Acer negundo]
MISVSPFLIGVMTSIPHRGMSSSSIKRLLNKEEWLIVEEEWGNTAYIGGFEYPVPTQFTTKDKWAKGVLLPESRDILGRIIKRRYTNMQYPTLDPFEGARLERYLRISFALPVFVIPLVTGSPTSSRIRDLALLSSTSPVPSPSPSPFNTAKVPTGPTQPVTYSIPPFVPVKSSTKIPIPPPVSTGSFARTPTRPSTRTPAHPSIKAMLARVAKARVMPSQEKPEIIEREATPVYYPATDIPSGSRSGSVTHDEVVSQFIASCPGESLMNMVKLPAEILAAKGASILAEGFKFALAMEKQLLTLKEAYIGLQARLADTQQKLAQAQQKLAQAQQSVAPLVQAAAASKKGRQAAMREKTLLQDETRLLRESVQNLEAQEGLSFEDGYFTACYEVAKALPPPFDLQLALNWDREQIMANAAQFAGKDQAEGDFSLDNDPVPSSEVILVEKEENDPVRTGVSEVEATKDSMAAEEEEDSLVGSKVPAVKDTQTGTAADVTSAEVVNQGATLKEEENALLSIRVFSFPFFFLVAKKGELGTPPIQ